MVCQLTCILELRNISTRKNKLKEDAEHWG
jgi:hypothetical protein